MTPTSAAIAELTATEVRDLVRAHPQLADASARVFAFSAESPREAEVLADLITAACRRLEEQATSVRDVLHALLPPASLAVSAPVLAQVRRNAEARQALIAEFGLVNSAELARLNHSRAANAAAFGYRLRKQGRLFAVDVAGDAQYPGFEFAPDGTPLAVVAEVIAAFGNRLAGWDLALWFTGSNGWLGGSRPVDAIGGTEEDRTAVVEAARELGAELDSYQGSATGVAPAASA